MGQYGPGIEDAMEAKLDDARRPVQPRLTKCGVCKFVTTHTARTCPDRLDEDSGIEDTQEKHA